MQAKGNRSAVAVGDKLSSMGIVRVGVGWAGPEDSGLGRDGTKLCDASSTTSIFPSEPKLIEEGVPNESAPGRYVVCRTAPSGAITLRNCVPHGARVFLTGSYAACEVPVT